MNQPNQPNQADCIVFEPPNYGLCNRLRGLVGAWAGSKKLRIPLFVLWNTCSACPYTYSDLFEPLSKHPDVIHINNTAEIPEKYNRKYHTTSVSHLNDILQSYAINPDIASFLISQLIPVANLRAEITGFYKRYSLDTNTLGIHIRETDIIDYLSSIKAQSVPVVNYYNAIDKWLKNNSSNTVYLACDDSARQMDILMRFGTERIIVYKNIASSEEACAPLCPPAIKSASSLRQTTGDHCVVDLYCLALSARFIGSPYSSFSTHVNYLRETFEKVPLIKNRIIATY
jgi:hypothetical protein